MFKNKYFWYIAPIDRLTFLKSIISRFYPFSESDFEKFIELSKEYDSSISRMQQEKFGTSETYKELMTPTGLEMLSFDSLASNESMKWTDDLIDRYYKDGRWNWDILSLNRSLPWSLNFIIKHQDKLKWEYDYENKSILFNIGIHWSKPLLDEFKDKLDWEVLSQHPNLPWSEDFINHYNDSIDFKSFSYIEEFDWTIEFIDKYKDKLDWKLLSNNPTLPWSEGFINYYNDNIDFKSFSLNEGFDWTIEFIDKYKDKLDWKYLSSTPTLPWSEDFINYYYESIDFESFSLNEGFDWTIEFIDKYKDKLDWGFLSENPNLPWSEDFILRYHGKWNYKRLSSNEEIKWTSKLIELFKENIESSEKNTSWALLSSTMDSQNFEEILKCYSEDYLWYKVDYKGIFYGGGLSVNDNLFKKYFEKLSIEEIVDILYNCKIESNKYDESIKYSNIQKGFNKELYEYQDSEVVDDEIEPYTFYDDPNYDHDSDIDQQGPYFDF